ncbi:hypothetical protein CYY_002471 [Polysphondylium violaceum]|uniref:Uncharacterized protein n=1 Tax=Polysphondylium violaceum TaxID=133409 RepID=A0A8J4V0T5_9MYCE|nr:hypothetical protein CYY_002471 [Polysphondylium violaceum]
MLSIGSKIGMGVGASFLPESSVLKNFAKYISMGTGAILILLSILSIFWGHYIIGPICIALGGLMLVLEFAVPFLAQFNFFIIIFDYKVRGPMYILFCIPAFFSVFSIAGGLGCIASGALYAVLGFVKNEKPEVPQYQSQNDIEQGHGGKKKSSLASHDQEY